MDAFDMSSLVLYKYFTMNVMIILSLNLHTFGILCLIEGEYHSFLWLIYCFDHLCRTLALIYAIFLLISKGRNEWDRLDMLWMDVHWFVRDRRNICWNWDFFFLSIVDITSQIILFVIIEKGEIFDIWLTFNLKVLIISNKLIMFTNKWI